MPIRIERVLPLRFGLGGADTTIVPNGFALQGGKGLKIALLVQKCAWEETRNQPRERISQVTLVRSQAASTVPSYSRYGEAALRGKETLLIEEGQSGSRLCAWKLQHMCIGGSTRSCGSMMRRLTSALTSGAGL